LQRKSFFAALPQKRLERKARFFFGAAEKKGAKKIFTLHTSLSGSLFLFRKISDNLYGRGVKANNLLLIIVCFLFFAGVLSAGETRLEFGREDGFRGVTMGGLDIVRGADGSADLVLRDRQRAGGGIPDLYLSFDEDPIRDGAGKFSVQNRNHEAQVSGNHKMRGRGAGVFQYGARLVLTPEGNTLFSRGTMSEDFSISFWMYPATLSEGEVVFRWENTSGEGGGPEYQEVSCIISARALRWTFENFFYVPGGEEKNLTLSGSVPLTPRTWRHHCLRFEAATGLVEYLVDGQPEAILYATASGGEGGAAAYPRVGGTMRTPFIIGEGFTGFLDEFSIERNPSEYADLAAFSPEGGSAETSVIDLGYGGCELLRINAVWQAPGDSGVFFYYRLGANLEELEAGDWTPFTPGAALPSKTLGQYLRVKAELFPDGRRSLTPRLMDFTVVYEKNMPPPPPSFVAASAGDGRITLRWSAVADSRLKGYVVYYGSKPGVYDGTESSLGPSPVRVGNETSVTLEGLTNGKLYYFVLSSYDEYSDLRGQFSNEVSSRPSRLYHRE
jgi:hypothetical protein